MALQAEQPPHAQHAPQAEQAPHASQPAAKPVAGAGTACGFSWAIWPVGCQTGAAESATATETASNAPEPTIADITVRDSRFAALQRRAVDLGCAWRPVHVKPVNMSWENKKRGQRGYHHGHLREALIKAALDLIGEKGPAGFTFAEAARSAGVSAAAPYRHFRDRDALMAEVARQGFERFGAFLANAWSDGAPDPVTAFDNVGRAYLAFARTEPAYYAAMFEAQVPPDASPELAHASDEAFFVLQRAAEAMVARLPKTGRPPARMVSLHMWSFAHGVASLFARGDTARRKLPMTPEELLEAGFLIYLAGLGKGPAA